MSGLGRFHQFATLFLDNGKVYLLVDSEYEV